MFREDRELLCDLKRACNEAGQFVLEYMADELSVEDEESYALRLINIAERLLAHAKGRTGLVLDGEPIRLVIDAESVRVGYEVRELPLASQPGDGGDGQVW